MFKLKNARRIWKLISSITITIILKTEKKNVSLTLLMKGYSHQKKDYQEINNEHHMYYLLFWFWNVALQKHL